MTSSVRNNKIQLVLFTGAFVNLSFMPAMATDYSPIDTASAINLNNGDRVLYTNLANTTDVIGIKSTANTGSLTINGKVDVNITNGTKSIGIHLANSHQNDLGSSSSITVLGKKPIDTALIDTVSGIEVLGSTTKLAANNLTIDATNTDATGGAVGIIARLGGTVTLTGDNNTITVQGGSNAAIGASAGLQASNQKGTSVAATNIIKVNDKITIITNNALGAHANTNSSIDLGKGSVIKTGGKQSFGVLATNTAAKVVGSKLSIETTGTDAYAIAAMGGGDIDIGEGSSVKTKDAFSLYVNSSNGGPVTTSTLDYIGSDNNRNKVTINTSQVGLASAYSQGNGAFLNVEKTDIVAVGASGVRADSSGTMTVKNSTIKVTPTVNNSIFAVYASNGGIATITGNTTIEANDYMGSALFASGASTINVQGKVDITGNIDSFQTGSVISMDTAAGSIFNGRSEIENNGTVNLKMTSSAWSMNNDSQVTNLTLLSGSQVSFTNTNFKTLRTNTLSGNGLFNMDVDLIGQQSDLLVVDGTVSGNHKIKIPNNGLAATTGTETLTIVQTGVTNNPINSFSLVNNVELGAYEYGLRAVPGASNNVQLYSLGQKLSSTALAAGSFLNISYLTNYVENQTLLQRLGDLRNNEYGTAKQDGFWIKGFGGKLNSFAGNALKGFDMTYMGTQLGIDKSIDVDNGNLVVGVMAGFTRTNPNYRQGDGNGKNYTAGVYTTYLMDNGIYVDNVLKFNSMRSHFSVKDTAGNAVKGTGKTHGVSFSTEIGKRFWLTDQKHGFYLEPQAQLSYGYQTGDTVKSSNSLKVGLSHYNSTLGRISGIIGYQTHGKTPVNVYLKTGVVREMSGGANYRFNGGYKNGHSFRSNWFDNGIGVDVNINKKHNIYAEADYATGNQFDNAKLNVGYRYSF